VTHKVSILSQVDEIIVLKNGTISDKGTFKNVLTRKGAFAEFLVEYLSKSTD